MKYPDTLLFQPHNPTSGSSLTYIIRLRDGRFVILDGGIEFDGAQFVSELMRLVPDDAPPFTVAAWFISHPHSDHITLLHRLLDDEKALGRVKIGKLYANIPDPELVIRTSGEQRLSNYLLWQSAYSEFIFTPILWPDFTPEEYEKCIEEYQKRDRRFGGRNK